MILAVGADWPGHPRTGCAPAKRRVRAAAETDSLLARATSARNVDLGDLLEWKLEPRTYSLG